MITRERIKKTLLKPIISDTTLMYIIRTYTPIYRVKRMKTRRINFKIKFLYLKNKIFT